MQEGVEKLSACIDSFKDVSVSDRGLIWNTDLIETKGQLEQQVYNEPLILDVISCKGVQQLSDDEALDVDHE